ncbi:MAG: hypothetical protein H7Y33_14285 [Cytophagales bacterium]|nr:hypothetical protein [Rhizobacter sp.]
MKLCPALIVPLLLCGCVSIEMPGLVADTANVAKDAYKNVTARKQPNAPEPAQAAASSAGPARAAMNHAYVGTETQSVADIKQNCVTEAAQKLAQLNGKSVPYSVAENEVSVINGRVVANCKLVSQS